MDRDTLIRTLNSSPAAVRTALTTLHARQTTDEQRNAATRHRNAMGFNATDAAFLSSLADRVNAGHPLSMRQLAAARRALPKYAGQLLASGVEWGKFVGPRRDAPELRAMETLAAELLEEAATQHA